MVLKNKKRIFMVYLQKKYILFGIDRRIHFSAIFYRGNFPKIVYNGLKTIVMTNKRGYGGYESTH
jgi:hypothetical protein